MPDGFFPPFDYRNPDYKAVFTARLERLAWLRANPKELPLIRAHYRANPWDLINDWGVTYDPRNPESDLPSAVPFILFERDRVLDLGGRGVDLHVDAEGGQLVAERGQKRADGRRAPAARGCSRSGRRCAASAVSPMRWPATRPPWRCGRTIRRF